MQFFQTAFIVLFFAGNVALAQTEHKGVHQEQSEQYSGYNFKAEKEWDSLRFLENGIPSISEKNASPQTCALKKRVFGWNPYWMGSSYLNYDWSLLSDLCHFS